MLKEASHHMRGAKRKIMAERYEARATTGDDKTNIAGGLPKLWQALTVTRPGPSTSP